jgi:hypothetical protein
VQWLQEQINPEELRGANGSSAESESVAAELDDLSLSQSPTSTSWSSGDDTSSSRATSMSRSDSECLSATRFLRSFANDFFEVKESNVAGLGAFAVKRLEKGQRILVETPLLETNMTGLFGKVDSMTKLEKAVFFSLAGWSRKEDASDTEKVADANG